MNASSAIPLKIGAWESIDIWSTACRVMAKRLRDVCTCRKANALARRTRLRRPPRRGRARHSALAVVVNQNASFASGGGQRTARPTSRRVL